jgi:hypothetical protein
MPAFIIMCLVLPKFAGIIINDRIQCNISITESVGVKVTLYTHIREELASNLDHDIDYPVAFRDFILSFQANAQILPRSGYGCFLPNPFQLIVHFTIRC